MTVSSDDIFDVNVFAAKRVDSYINFSLAAVNDHTVRMSVMTKAFYWHYHPDSDETFIVTEGVLLIDLDDVTLELASGQMITIPAGTVHRTRPKGGRSINLTIEKTSMETIRIEKS